MLVAGTSIENLDGTVGGGRGEDMALGGGPLDLLDAASMAAESFLGGGPASTLLLGGDEDATVVITGSKLSLLLLRMSRPVDGVSFGAAVHTEGGGGLVGGGGEGTRGGARKEVVLRGKVPDLNVTVFHHGGGGVGEGGDADTVCGGVNGDGLVLDNAVFGFVVGVVFFVRVLILGKKSA